LCSTMAASADKPGKAGDVEEQHTLLLAAIESAKEAVKAAGTDVKAKKKAEATLRDAEAALRVFEDRESSVGSGVKSAKVEGQGSARSVGVPPGDAAAPCAPGPSAEMAGVIDAIARLTAEVKAMKASPTLRGRSGSPLLYQDAGEMAGRPMSGAGEVTPAPRGATGLMQTLAGLAGSSRSPPMNMHQPKGVEAHPGFVTAGGGYVAWQPEVALNHQMVAEQSRSAAVRASGKKDREDDTEEVYRPAEQPPYYDLGVTKIRHMMHLQGGLPLRVTQRLANSLLYDIFLAEMSACDWVESYIPNAKKSFPKREMRTLARMLDIHIMEMGWEWVEKSGACEVMLRRMHSLKLADQQGNWKLASWLEEIPHSQRPGLHEVVIKGLVNQANLYDKATKASGFGGEEPE
jgi:hypothetical protein